MPAIYQYLERSGKAAGKDVDRLSRDLQFDLLQSVREEDGAIGKESGRGIVRPPSEIYWNALAMLGLATQHVSEASYQRRLSAGAFRLEALQDDERWRIRTTWSPSGTRRSACPTSYPTVWGVQPIRLPPKSPNLNAYAERFVRSMKEECLSRVVPLGEGHVRLLVGEYVEHDHRERNHQGLDNQLLQRPPPPVSLAADVQRRERLGGLLNFYHREAA